MARRVRVVDGVSLRGAIAETWLGGELVNPRLGKVTLRPDQIDAVKRVRAALREYGGALLADPVGSGKTYCALAVVRERSRPLVVGPAALEHIWRIAAEDAALAVDFMACERLSRGRRIVNDGAYDTIIVDEAHWFRNPDTRRYAALAHIARRAELLLLSGTPIHNSARDLSAVLGLFLGDRARTLTPEEFAGIVIRRTAESSASLPRLRRARSLKVKGGDGIGEAIETLPVPVPCRDSGVAHALETIGLLRMWSSSDAALTRALKRRVANVSALHDALASGRNPSRSELRSWTGGDDGLQLAFSELLIAATSDPAAAEHVTRYRNALLVLLGLVDGYADDRRAKLLDAIRSHHPGERIVALTQYAATAAMLFRKLSRTAGVALITSRCARIASGAVGRNFILDQFDPARPAVRAREQVSLLIATDLASEGLNLHAASVVVHMDLPWTPARLEQRTGRVRRIGSPHDTAWEYRFSHEPATAVMTRLLDVLRRKEMLSDELFEPVLSRKARSTPLSATSVDERLRDIVGNWVGSGTSVDNVQLDRSQLVGAVRARCDGFVALLRTGTRSELVVGSTRRVYDAQSDSALRILRDVGSSSVAVCAADYRRARRLIERWITTGLAHSMLGTPGNATDARLARRLQPLVTNARGFERKELARRVSAVKKRLGDLRPWAARSLESIARSQTRPEELLAAAESVLASAAASRDEQNHVRLIALLLCCTEPR